MKKLILTGCAATLFAIGSIAQVQDSVNNNLRQGAQETEQDAKEAGNELQRQTEQTGDEIKQDTKEAGNEIKQGAEQTGEDVEQKTREAGQEIEKSTDDAGNQIQQGGERVGDDVQQGADKAQESMDRERQPAQENQDASPTSMNAMPPQHDIEVLEDKEGPNNAVVYKYQGGLYYVDRETKQLVEIEESQLKDAQHKAIEHNATSSGNEKEKP